MIGTSAPLRAMAALSMPVSRESVSATCQACTNYDGRLHTNSRGELHDRSFHSPLAVFIVTQSSSLPASLGSFAAQLL